VWLPTQYRFALTSGPLGELYVVVGVWAAYEATRTSRRIPHAAEPPSRRAAASSTHRRRHRIL
jgi:hypothetical protein